MLAEGGPIWPAANAPRSLSDGEQTAKDLVVSGSSRERACGSMTGREKGWTIMTWETPVVTELDVAMEVTGYTSEGDDTID